MTDMNPQDAITRLDEIRREIGPKAEIYVSLNTRYNFDAHTLIADPTHVPFKASVMPFGWGTVGKKYVEFKVDGHSLREIVENVATAWAGRREELLAEPIRELALKIIALQADNGHVDEATLRLEGFSAETVQSLGALACAAADKLAAGGPFTIEPTGGVPNGQ